MVQAALNGRGAHGAMVMACTAHSRIAASTFGRCAAIRMGVVHEVSDVVHLEDVRCGATQCP